jgi:hypothetical protein
LTIVTEVSLPSTAPIVTGVVGLIAFPLAELVSWTGGAVGVEEVDAVEEAPSAGMVCPTLPVPELAAPLLDVHPAAAISASAPISTADRRRPLRTARMLPPPSMSRAQAVQAGGRVEH